MYQEFRELASDDAEHDGPNNGMKDLMKYYSQSVLSARTIMDDNIVRDFVEHIKAERSDKERPMFAKLRNVWRNGAWDMKNRHKVTKFLDADLSAELDR